MLIRKDLQRLSQNGSSACVNIRRPVLRHLGWIPGMSLIVEVMDDDSLRVRAVTPEDLGPQIPRARQLPTPIAVEA